MSWKEISLGHFLKNRPERFKPNDPTISGLKRIDKIDFSGKVFLSDKSSNTDMILVKKGDLVISGINVEKGAMAVFSGDSDVTATIHYSSYEFDETKIDIEFLGLFLRSSEFKKAIKEQVPGGIKTEIKPKHLLPLKVWIPSEIQEQKVLVRILQTKNTQLRNVSEQITHQLSLVKQLRQAFLREAMQGKLLPQNPADEPASELLRKIKAEKEELIKEKKLKKEKPLPPIKPEEIPFEIPENWVWCRLGEIAESRLGKMLDKTKNKGTPYPYLRNVNVQWYKINLSDLLQMRFQDSELEEFSLRKGDLMICEGGYPGRSALWISDESSIKFQKALHRVRFFGKIESLLYLYYLDLICNNGFIRNYFTGSGIQHLTGKSLNVIPFPVPPLPEQLRIVQKLEQLMQLCDGLEQSISQSQQQNEMLLQQVLREALEPGEVNAG